MTKPWNNQAGEPFDETLISPRFDQKAVSGARPVVPITGEREDEMTLTAAQNFRQPRVTSLSSIPKPSWTLALVITLALVVGTAGGVVIHRRSSMPSQYQEHVSATAATVLAGESAEGERSTRRSERTVPRPRGQNDFERDVYYSVLPTGKLELSKGRDEDRGKYDRREGKGEEKRRYREDKGHDKEKERGKGRSGKGKD